MEDFPAMIEQANADAPAHSTDGRLTDDAPYSDDHLFDRGMYCKEYDLLDTDRGRFWHKLSWHGVHVEFLHRLGQHDPHHDEKTVRAYFIDLPVDVLDEAFSTLQQAPKERYTLQQGCHRFTLEWSEAVQHHLHCGYERSAQGREADRAAHEAWMARYAAGQGKDRPLPGQRLNAELAALQEQRARAQQVVDAWDSMIVLCQERIARDQILHRPHFMA